MLPPTNLKITVASHVFSPGHIIMHANPGIDEGGGTSRGAGGMLQKKFEIFVP